MRTDLDAKLNTFTLHIEAADLELLTEVAAARRQSLGKLLSDAVKLFAIDQRKLVRFELSPEDCLVRRDIGTLEENLEDDGIPLSKHARHGRRLNGKKPSCFGRAMRSSGL